MSVVPSKKLLLVPIMHVRPVLWSGTEISWPLQNALLDLNRVQSVLNVLLSRQTKNKEGCFLCKWRQHTLKDSLFENYELSLRLTNEVFTDGSEHVHRIGFYGISYVWGCGVKVSTLTHKKDPMSCIRVNVQDVS